ncbi:hypothetical protein [Streptomyces sp. NPDC048659]|uniref:hypothetical protein n=1 Tax=Streptomyces sp. NPDC048659 TaxID=3155489 RepID=UPI00344444BF
MSDSADGTERTGSPAATDVPDGRTAPVTAPAPPPLVEAAWLYRAGEVCLEELPMGAAHALAAGWDTPSLRELAGLPRRAVAADIRDAFVAALEELGIPLPDRPLSLRYALRRLAVRFAAGEVGLAGTASDEWAEVEAETAEERAFLALLPSCACCVAYTLGLDDKEWEVQLRAAAQDLIARPAVGPGL